MKKILFFGIILFAPYSISQECECKGQYIQNCDFLIGSEIQVKFSGICLTNEIFEFGLLEYASGDTFYGSFHKNKNPFLGRYDWNQGNIAFGKFSEDNLSFVGEMKLGKILHKGFFKNHPSLNIFGFSGYGELYNDGSFSKKISNWKAIKNQICMNGYSLASDRDQTWDAVLNYKNCKAEGKAYFVYKNGKKKVETYRRGRLIKTTQGFSEEESLEYEKYKGLINDDTNAYLSKVNEIISDAKRLVSEIK